MLWSNVSNQITESSLILVIHYIFMPDIDALFFVHFSISL